MPQITQMNRLIEIMAKLRSPTGCPWDREQTHNTLKPYLIEEAYELIDAIDDQSDQNLKEELGDVLLQVVFHAQIATEEGRFNMEDIAKTIADKLERRHPHVFGTVQADTPEEVIKNWEAIKAKEKDSEDGPKSALDGVPRHLPALSRAYQIQKKAAKVGFDWDNAEEVWKKVDEEVQELKQAQNLQEQQEELGDLLFSVVNLSRFVGTNPEEALTQTISKFQKRFTYIESELQKNGQTPADASLAKMDELWEKAKTDMP